MRLVNSFKVQLEEFADNDVPVYAILSHTWEKDEVLFSDMEAGRVDGKAGYAKIRRACETAAADGHEYIWIDTCCIDKRSSAELSEAINSMYSWYHKAVICYTYLADVPTDVDTQAKEGPFAKSRWFTRGWTLQELLAPATLAFFSQDWVEIGRKSTLYDAISKITGIHESILSGLKDLESTSIATRMSWASKRDTTRTEDRAYCLMGIFGVNMPMLYGEGEKSFIRLQEEIMKDSDDQSIFAWIDPTAPESSHRGLLAIKPAHFINSGNILPYRGLKARAPYSNTNKGLCITLGLTRYDEDIYIAALDCPAPPSYEGFIGIYLKCLSTGNEQYARINLNKKLCKIDEQGNLETIYVRQNALVSSSQDLYLQHVFQLRNGPTEDQDYKLLDTVGYPSVPVLPAPLMLHARDRSWIPPGSRFLFKISSGHGQLAGALYFTCGNDIITVALASTTDFGVAFDAILGFMSIEELERAYEPQAPGTYIILEAHQVCVTFKLQTHQGVKYYLVDVIVERNPDSEHWTRMIPMPVPQIEFTDFTTGIERGPRTKKWKSPIKVSWTKKH